MNVKNITLQLDIFEGPLDLLLYLIKKHDLEISRVSIAEVTDQYLSYLGEFKELDVDFASDFLYMAAELAHIKSRMLLPGEDKEGEEGEEDVADDLIARLKEYERYKLAAENLKKRHWLNRDVFMRGSFVEEEVEKVSREEKNEDGEFDCDSFELIKAFHEIINRLPKDEAQHHVAKENMSVMQCMYGFLDRLKDRESILFEEMFEGMETRIDVVIGFLAVLEMAKLKLVRVYQTENFAPIRLQRRIEITDETLNKEVYLDLEEDYR